MSVNQHTYRPAAYWPCQAVRRALTMRLGILILILTLGLAACDDVKVDPVPATPIPTVDLGNRPGIVASIPAGSSYTFNLNTHYQLPAGISITPINQPAGTLELNPVTLDYTWTPDSLKNGTDELTFSICNSNNQCQTATVRITYTIPCQVSFSNRAMVLLQTRSTLNGNLVLDSNQTTCGQALTYRLIGLPVQGFSIIGNRLQYRGANNTYYAGPNNLQVQVTNSQNQPLASFTVTVIAPSCNDYARANDDTLSAIFGSTVSSRINISSLLANDYACPGFWDVNTFQLETRPDSILVSLFVMIQGTSQPIVIINKSNAQLRQTAFEYSIANQAGTVRRRAWANVTLP